MAKNVEWIGLKDLQRAVRRNPRKVLSEARRFLTRGIAEYKRSIIRDPWRIGGTGGGAPVRTGNLRDTHYTQVNRLSASIGPDPFIRYAKFVHRGTRRMPARPWLDYAKKTKQDAVESHYRQMLKNIVRDLAR